MTRLNRHPGETESQDKSVTDLLLVGEAPAGIAKLSADVFSRVDSGTQALELLKVLRFRLLLSGLDVPDMPPWELFTRARRTQARLQCAVADDRLTLDDERRIRMTGAAVFGSNDPMLEQAIARLLPATSRFKPPRAPVPERAPP